MCYEPTPLFAYIQITIALATSWCFKISPSVLVGRLTIFLLGVNINSWAIAFLSKVWML